LPPLYYSPIVSLRRGFMHLSRVRFLASNIVVVLLATSVGTALAQVQRKTDVRLLSRPTSTTASVLQSISLSQASVIGGVAVAGAVTLARPAIGGGVVVTLSSNTAAATVMPAQVTVPAGATSAIFTVNTTPVAINPNVLPAGVQAAITATPAAGFGSPKSATLTVMTPMLTSFGILGPVVGSQATGGIVQLSGPAPTGGIPIKLASNNEAVVRVPAVFSVAAGVGSASFKVATSSVAAPTSVIISASRSALNFKDVTLTVLPPSLAVVGCEPFQVTNGTPVTCTVWLDGLAATKLTVTLSSSNPEVFAVPAGLSVDAGHSHAPFTVTTQGFGPASPVYSADVHISASYAGATIGTTVKVTRPLPKLASVSCGCTLVAVEGFFVGSQVTLTGPAPDPGGARIDYTITGAGYPWTAYSTVPPGNVQYGWGVHLVPTSATVTVTVQVSYNGATKSASCSYP
jgi:hypothetical protein